MPSPTPADNDRVGGWMKMYEGLRYGEWIISSDCHKLIACLPSLTRDEPPHQEDCIKFIGDDEADAARYGIYSDAVANETPLNEKVAASVAEMQKICPAVVNGVVDYNVVAMQSRIAEDRERKKSMPVRRNLKHRWGPPRHMVEAYR